MRSMKNRAGMTLLEVVVGLVVFAIGVLPLLLAHTRAANTSRVRAMAVAHALLKGEASLLFETGMEPPATRTVALDGRTYVVGYSCACDTVPAFWRLHVALGDDTLARLAGALHALERAP